MCGICGVIQIGGEPRTVLPPGVLDRMTDAMTHRGPNDRGTHTEPGAAIGARRLSIVDIADGHQPFTNEHGTIWAAQNGELYNHVELRRELERTGHRFLSRCDTEVLPHLYEELGCAFAERLRGMFGLVVWDGPRRRSVIARDRLGIKPIYYAQVDDLLVFASELKSLLASGLVSTELDYEAIDVYLRLGFTPAPLSPLAGVRKLRPGHRLIVENAIVREEAYWRYPEPRPGDPRLGADHYAEQLIHELDESVRLRLMSDVPLGAMLSGGLDSSLIVALMAQHMSEPVKTFSIGFAEAGDTNELGDARLVADTFGTDHRELELSFHEQDVDLSELTWYLDEPIADLSALGFLALSGLAAEHVTVALAGQGADELFGGYLKHRAASLCNVWERVPAFVQAGSRSLAPRAPRRARRAMKTLSAGNPAARLLAMSSKLDDNVRREIVRGPLARLDGGAALEAITRVLGDTRGSALATTLYLDGQLALPDDMLHYFDRTSMAYSLEVRVPFLDHHVVEYAATIPDALKVRRLTTKYLLKRAARGTLPDSIIDKRKLGFFRPEVERWFRAHARGAISDYLLGPDPAYAAILDRGAVERLVAAHVTGEGPGNQHLLLAILMLEVWLTSYLPRAGAYPKSARERISVRA